MTVQYQGVWSLQSAAQLQSTQRWVTDPLFENTTLLLQADDAANGAQNNTFLDSSSNSFAITRNGNTTQGSFTPFSSQPGAWSNFFGGTGNYATSTSSAIATSTTTFTIEGWIYATATPVTTSSIPSVIADCTPANTQLYWGFGPLANGTLSFYWYDGTSRSAVGNSTIALNTWTHIAVSVNANAITLYVNGTQQTLTGTTTLTNRSGSTATPITFAQFSTGGSYFAGYISNFSILSGTSKYSTSFTPSTTPLATGTTNQVLLFAAGNRFADFNTATTAKTFTITGTPSVQAFSPFAPQFQWTPSVIGGSGFFDGTGDYLSAAANTALTFGTGDFTVEGWFYANALGGQPALLNNGSDAGGLVITTLSSKIYAYFVGAGNVFGSGGATLATNTWYHFAWVRSGSTHTFYLNGAVYGATYSSAGNHASTGGVGIGYSVAGTAFAAWNGYIANVRMVKGTAVYSGAFTPPIAPVTTSGPASSYSSTTNVNTTFTSTNTSLLTNFTNAGIFDGTMKNNLETVGNAQVSTAVVKYGSGSLAFDGTGDYLSLPVQRTIELGSADWTFETWVYMNAVSSQQSIIYLNGNTSGYAALNLQVQSGALNLWLSANGSSWSLQQNTIGTIAANAWNHIAVVKVGTNIKVYINGTNVSGNGYTVAASLMTTYTVNQIGVYNASSYNLNGYLDDLRVTLGIARYTQNFIPPSVALPRQ